MSNGLIPANGSLAPVPAVEVSSRTAAISPLASLRRHPVIAVVAAIAMMAAAWLALKAKMAPKYSAEALVYVSPTFIKNLQQDHEQDTQVFGYDTFIQDQVKSVARYEILAAALSKLGERRSVWQTKGQTERNAVEQMQARLVVERVPETYQVKIALEGGSPEGLAETVNAIATTFVDRARKDEFYDRPERLEVLERENGKLRDEFAKKSAERTELTQELGFVALPTGDPNPVDELLLRSREDLAAAEKARIEAEAKVDAFRGVPSASDGPLQALAAEIASGDSGLSSLKSNLNKRRSELITQLSGLSPTTPLRAGAERELKAIDAELDRASSKVLTETSAQLLSRLQADLRRTQMVEGELRTATNSLGQNAHDLTSKLRDAAQLGFELEQIRRRMTEISDRVEYLMLESDAPGFVRVFALALPPEHPAKDGSKKLIAILLIIGTFSGLLFPIACDLFDPRVHDAEGAERILGFAPLGVMIEETRLNREAARDHALRLAVGIERAVERTAARSFFFTGVAAKSGTSYLVESISRELTGLGRRVLILKANAQEAAESSEPGLVQLLRSEVTMQEVLPARKAFEPVRILLGSTRPQRNLPTLAKMREILGAVRGQFDVIIVDGAALVASADAEYFVTVCDATIVVAHAGKVTKKQLKSASALMQRLRVAKVGFVLSRKAVNENERPRGIAEQREVRSQRLSPIFNEVYGR